GLRPQWSPPGGRTYGKINLNPVYDLDTFQALSDRQGLHFFTDLAVSNIFQKIATSRGMPGGTSRPFLGLAAPFAPPGLQYPQGASSDDTIPRPDPHPPATRPARR